MYRPQGYAVIADPDAPMPVLERDTVTCGHCQRIVETKAGTVATVYLVFDGQRYHEEPGAGCRVCMRAICLPCYEKGTCTPWERRMEAIEARDRFLRSAGIG